MPQSHADNLKRSFSRDGLLAPIRLMTGAQCGLAMSHFRSGTMATPMAWQKGLAASERFVFDLAIRPGLAGLLRELLGEDIILWGAAFSVRPPRTTHPWHCDIESSAPQGNFVSVWIGLEHTSRVSALRLVQRSHHFGKTIQDVQSEHGFGRGEADDTQVLAWARGIDADAEIVQPEMSDGEAIVFDGRLWHAGMNTLAAGERTALVLQFARGDEAVYMPDLAHLEGPPRLILDRRPPVVAVSGLANEQANFVVPPPNPGLSGRITTVFTRSLDLPLERDLEGGWKPHFLFNGPTRTLEHLSCHVSVLEGGHCPHPAAGHLDEELLIVLDGKAEIIIAASPDDPSPRREKLVAGDIVYHPAYHPHTLENTSAEPVTYLMFKWRSGPLEVEKPLDSAVARLADFPAPADPRPFHPRMLFEAPTAFLSKLHVHVTDLKPGAGYEPHSDDYDVAILLLQGQIVTAGKTLTAPAIAFFARDQRHGMHNAGRLPARYLVFEFHVDENALSAVGSQLWPLAADLTPSIREIARLRQERDALKAHCELLNADVELLRTQLEHICRSRSWRYTSAIRSVLSFVRQRMPGRGRPE